MSDTPDLISIVRTPYALTALIAIRIEGTFIYDWLPVADLTKATYPAKARLLASWARLGQATGTDQQTLSDLLVVLLETVADPDRAQPSNPLPALWNAAPAPPKATRAHPRAFKGTKFQPPKASILPPTDLRPYLCDARSLRVVAAPLWKFEAMVRAELVQAGYSIAALDAAAMEFGPIATRRAPWNLPAPYALYLWRSARAKPARDRSRLLTRYHALELEADRKQLTAFAHLAAVAGLQRTCDWATGIHPLPPHRRIIVLEKLIAEGATLAPPIPEAADSLEEASALASDENFASWAEQLLLVMQRHASPDYLLAGFRIASQLSPGYPFRDVERCADFPQQDVEEIGISLDEHGWLPMGLWDRCGRLPGLPSLIRRSHWRSFAPDAARAYLQILINVIYTDLSPRALKEKWAVIAEHFPALGNLLLATSPEYQTKVVECVSDWFACWDDPTLFRRGAARGIPLLRRLAAPPFQPGVDIGRTMLSFLEEKDEATFRRILQAPDASFGALEKACRRDNYATLIARGLETLTRWQGEFIADCFLTNPHRLFRTAKLLGGVSAAARLQILRECQSPIQLALIEQRVRTWLKRGLPARDITKSDEHALRLLGSIRENRRGLRKFLNAYWSGDRQYLAQHPATVAWYRKQKPFPRHVWEQGISFPAGTCRIEMEQDPFEILKLGTYVGSCLEIGGLCAYSAVAVLLDANKRVLYARDDRNRVLARQLVAISDQGSLVCFPVYPLSATKVIQAEFKEYDQALATALGVPLYQPAEDDAGYEIGCVLSASWWDDGSWDFADSSVAVLR